MAEFIINIESIKPTYDRVTTSLHTEECTELNNSYPVQLESIADGIHFSIFRGGSYVGNAWKTLTITGANSSNPDFVLKYNGVQITSPVQIDITGLAGNNVIPLLTVEATGSSDKNDTHTISVTFTITDVNNIEGLFVNSSIQLVGLTCVFSDPTITLTGFGVSACSGIAQLFTITGDANQTIRYQITTVDNGNNGYNAILKDANAPFQYSPAVAPGTGNTVSGNITLDGAGIKELSYDVCAIEVPPLIVGCVEVLFTLYKADNVTLNTLERFNVIDCL